MIEKSSKPAGVEAMSVAFTAIDRTRGMVRDIGGPLEWTGNKESWRVKTARKINDIAKARLLSPRRIRAILSQSEKVRLSADEYLAIERAWLAAGGDLAAFSTLASEADAQAHSLDAQRGGAAEGRSATADHEALAPASGAAVRPAR